MQGVLDAAVGMEVDYILDLIRVKCFNTLPARDHLGAHASTRTKVDGPFGNRSPPFALVAEEGFNHPARTAPSIRS